MAYLISSKKRSAGGVYTAQSDALSNATDFAQPIGLCRYDTSSYVFDGVTYSAPSYIFNSIKKKNGIWDSAIYNDITGFPSQTNGHIAITKRSKDGIFWIAYGSSDYHKIYARKWNGSSWDNAIEVANNASLTFIAPQIVMNLTTGNIAVVWSEATTAYNVGNTYVRRYINSSWDSSAKTTTYQYTRNFSDANTYRVGMDTNNNVYGAGAVLILWQTTSRAWGYRYFIFNGTTFTSGAIPNSSCQTNANGNNYWLGEQCFVDHDDNGRIIIHSSYSNSSYLHQGYKCYFYDGSWSTKTAKAAGVSTVIQTAVVLLSSTTWGILISDGTSGTQFAYWDGSNWSSLEVVSSSQSTIGELVEGFDGSITMAYRITGTSGGTVNDPLLNNPIFFAGND